MWGKFRPEHGERRAPVGADSMFEKQAIGDRPMGSELPHRKRRADSMFEKQAIGDQPIGSELPHRERRG